MNLPDTYWIELALGICAKPARNATGCSCQLCSWIALFSFHGLFKLLNFPRGSSPGVHFYMHDWIQICQYLIIGADRSGEDHDLLIAVIEDCIGSHELT